MAGVVDHRLIAGRFNARLGRPANTMVVGGACEPLYLPARGTQPAMIRYTRDHAASVLHELAHWCLADADRRRQVDYGLWYQPPPRTPAVQARFYAAEVPVQALEWLLATACGIDFHFSADNPGDDGGCARASFEAQVTERFVSLRAAPDAISGDTRRLLDALNPDWPSAVAT